MNENSKVYTKTAIRIGTFLGGPLAAGYMMAKNFKAFGKLALSKVSLVLGLLSMVFILILVFLIPENVFEEFRFANMVIPFIYTAITESLFVKYQQKDIELYLQEEGNKASYWKAAGVGVCGVFVAAVMFFIGVFYLAPIQPLYPGKIAEYGAQNHEVYIDENIKPSLSDSLALSLSEYGVFGDMGQGAAHIGRRDEYFVITFPFHKEDWNNEQYMNALYLLKDDLRLKFGTRNIIIRLHHIGFPEDEYEEI